MVWRQGGSGEKKVEKRLLVENDHLPYCGEYLLVNSEQCNVASIVVEEKVTVGTWLFKR